MAKRTMLKADIFALKKDRKAILETIQRMGIIEVTTKKLKTKLFERTDTSSAVMQFERNIQTATNALGVLNEYEKEKTSMLSSLSGRAMMSVDEYYERAAEGEKTLKVCYDINAKDRKITEKKAEIARIENQIAACLPWETLDVPQRFKGTGKTAAFIGTFPEEWSEEEILTRIAQQDSALPVPYLEWISTSRDQTCVFILCHKNEAAAMETTLRNLGFSWPGTPSKQPPTEQIAGLKANIEALQAEIEEESEEILALTSYRAEIRRIIDILTMRRDKYEVISQLNQSEKTFMLTGYLPEDEADRVSAALNDRFDCVVELYEPGKKENVPILLRNNGFSAPTESIVEMYNMPSKNDIDPASAVAIFYYFLFGMMLSDAGYGLLMVLACGWALLKFKTMERGTKNTLKMFLYSGISTIFWGVMFGGFFGDLIPVVAKSFFDQTIVVPALWFAPKDDAMKLMIFSFLIGIIHLYTGMGIALYQKCKNKEYKDAFLDVGLWMILVGSLVILLLTTTMFADMASLTPLPAWLATPMTLLAGLSSLGIILFAGRSSKGPAKRVLKGIYELYGVSGYLSDILSYARLLALGLATGIVAEVINTMAAMTAGLPYGIGVILFIAIFLVGHAVNMGINALGAYVHTNRLQFVEFFGKFFEGGGRKFSPFGVKTKYFRVKEEK